MADATIEAKGGVLQVAYTKDEPSENNHRRERRDNNERTERKENSEKAE